MDWSFVLVATIISAPWALVAYFEWQWFRAELANERGRAERAESQSAHRGELLEQAKDHLAHAQADGEATIAQRTEMEDALRSAPAGGKLAAVERVLRDRAARAARREAEASAAAAGEAQAVAGGADPAEPGGVGPAA